MNRRNFLKSFSCYAISSLVLPLFRHRHTIADKLEPDNRKTNFIVIFTDDQGYGDVGCFGSDIPTPNLDQMAKQGMKFTDFYSAAPTCSPSRAALLTGCYPLRVSLPDVLFSWSRNGINPDEILLPEILKSEFYTTACIGKWHLGHKPLFLPTRNGFDQYFGLLHSNDMYQEKPELPLAENIKWRDEEISTEKDKGQIGLIEDEKVIEFPAEQSSLTRRYTEKAVDFIRDNKENPFFLYLAHTMPHVPLAVSKTFEGASGQGLYGDVIAEIDWSVGQVLKILDEMSLSENTLVVFTSDNGPYLAKGESAGSTGPLRDGKFSSYEGGMRMPCIMQWKGVIPPQSICSEVASTIDLLPTFAKLAGAKLPDGRVIDGQDISPLMKDLPNTVSPHEYFYYYRSYRAEAIRWKHWKYRQTKDEKQLFNLLNDIGEQNNLACQYPKIVRKLNKQLHDFNQNLLKSRRSPGKYINQSESVLSH